MFPFQFATMAIEGESSNSFIDELIYIYPLPKGLETNCPVCFVALYEDPFVNVECGHHLCGSCTKRLKDCPECRRTLKAIPDRGLQRVLRSLQVFCSQKESGCQWEGELGELQRHQNNDCLLVDTQCVTCDSKGPRHWILAHQKEECPNRTVSCEYCNHECMWKDLADKHYELCKLYPLNCYACNASIARQDEMEHIESFCPKTVVPCEASSYGCKWEGLREEREKHLKDDWVGHFNLCLKTCSSLAVESAVKSANETVAECKVEIEQLKNEVNEKDKEIDLLRQKISSLEDVVDDHSVIVSHIPTFHKELKKEVTVRLEKMASDFKEAVTNRIDDEYILSDDDTPEPEDEYDYSYQDFDDSGLSQASNALLMSEVKQKPTFEFKLKNVSKRQKNKESCLSPSFYVNHYNMRLRVHPNGYGRGEGSHLSVYMCLVKGLYDEIALWPFYGKVIIELLHNSCGKSHKKIVKYDFDIPEDFSTVSGSRKRSSKGNGCPKFLPLSELPSYLDNNTLTFHIYVHALS